MSAPYYHVDRDHFSALDRALEIEQAVEDTARRMRHDLDDIEEVLGVPWEPTRETLRDRLLLATRDLLLSARSSRAEVEAAVGMREVLEDALEIAARARVDDEVNR